MRRIGYLIGQFPAVNHFYLALEINRLRQSGLEVRVASIAPSDRCDSELREAERILGAETYVVKDDSAYRALRLLARALLCTPVRFARSARKAMSFARGAGKPSRYGLFYLAEAVLVADWIARERIGFLYSSFSAGIAAVVAELTGLPFGFGVYGYGELYDPVGGQLGRKIAGASFVRSVSRHGVGQLMLASAPEHWPKIHYIALGIEPDAFPPRPREKSKAFELLCVGRLSAEKGHRLLLAALARVVRSGRTVTLRFVGDGPERRALEEFAAHQGVERQVVFEGRVQQQRLDELYGSSSVFVMASLYEGIPIVLMEAMARELPCIAPAINGIPELLLHGETGLLFPTGDDETLAELITNLYDSPTRGKEYGVAARRRVKTHYDIVPNTDALASAFLRLPSMTL